MNDLFGGFEINPELLKKCESDLDLKNTVKNIAQEIAFKTESYLCWCLNELGVFTDFKKADDEVYQKFKDDLISKGVALLEQKHEGNTTYRIFKNSVEIFIFSYYVTSDMQVIFDVKSLEDSVDKN